MTVVLARIRFPTESLVLKVDQIRKNKLPRALYFKGPKVFLMSSLESKYFAYFSAEIELLNWKFVENFTYFAIY